MSYRKSYLIIALWTAFMLATACAGVMPRISQAAGILCPGRFEIDAGSPKNIKHFCRDEATGQLTRLNPFLVVGTNMAAFATVLLIPAAIIGGLRDRAEAGPRQRRQELRSSAVPASATVVAVREGGRSAKRAGRHTRDVELVLNLEVAAPGGRYPAEVRWMVGELHFAQVQVGQSVAVRVNPAQPERVYPAAEWATLEEG